MLGKRPAWKKLISVATPSEEPTGGTIFLDVAREFKLAVDKKVLTGFRQNIDQHGPPGLKAALQE